MLLAGFLSQLNSDSELSAPFTVPKVSYSSLSHFPFFFFSVQCFISTSVSTHHTEPTCQPSWAGRRGVHGSVENRGSCPKRGENGFTVKETKSEPNMIKKKPCRCIERRCCGQRCVSAGPAGPAAASVPGKPGVR